MVSPWLRPSNFSCCAGFAGFVKTLWTTALKTQASVLMTEVLLNLRDLGYEVRSGFGKLIK